MGTARFAWGELYRHHRFLAPVCEETLLAAAREAGAREGMTLLELHCGNAAAGLFLADAFHLYLRGVDSRADLLDLARRAAATSRAAARVRLAHDDAAHPGPENGPVDLLLALRGVPAGTLALLRPGGRVIAGRLVLLRSPAPRELREAFPEGERLGDRAPLWRREASPLEWERYVAPQERALAEYREGLRAGATASPVADAAERFVEAFRSNSAYVAYEVAVHAAGTA